MPRLTRLYTRTGDQGETGLASGERVSKDSPRLWAAGDVDELNSIIGLARAFLAEESEGPATPLQDFLKQLQNDLFDLGADLAAGATVSSSTPGRLTAEHIRSLEHKIDLLNGKLGPLEEFILPSGGRVGATLHVARTVCRRAERHCVHLSHQERLGEFVLPYLNRLSDALFVLAREVNRAQRRSETYWRKQI